MWFALGLAIVLGALGQILMKEAMKAAGPIPLEEGTGVLFLYFFKAFLSPWLIGAVVSYGISFIVWLGVLSLTDLSLIRPLMSAGYVLTLAYGYFAGEHVTLERVLGTGLVIAGIVFLVHSSQH